MNVIPDSGTTFETGATAYEALTYLDDTHFVIAYGDYGDSGKGKVVCGSTSGVTPTMGSIVEFESGSTASISIAMLDSTHFVIAYMDDDDSDKGKCVVGSVSGTTITLGAIVTYESDAAFGSVCGMDATHFVIAYRNDTVGDGRVIGASVSGTTITCGNSDIFESSTDEATDISICSLDSTHFVVAYRKQFGDKDGMVICGTLSGNTVSVTAGTATIFETGEADRNSIAALSSTHFVIVFADTTDSVKGKCIVGSVSGTTITISADSATTFETGPLLSGLSVAAISATQFLVSFADGGDSYKGKVIEGSVSGVTITITLDGATTFETGSCVSSPAYPVSCGILGDYFAIAFSDADDSYKGKVILGRYSATRQGAVAISSTASMTSIGTRHRFGVAGISSTPSLSALGNILASGIVSILAIPSLAISGGVTTPASVSIVAVSSMFVEWRVIGRCSIAAVSSLSITGNRMISAVIPITAIASLVANGTATFSGALDISSASSVAANGTRIKQGAVTITAVSSAEIDALAYVLQVMGYTGTLTAGDVLVIDCDEQTVELNGANAVRYFTGTFPQLYAGTNELIWEDGGEVPDLDFETKHEPRYL